MNNAKHTPGPWRVIPVARSTYDIAVITEGRLELVAESICIAANASLIAAAPDLLASLEQILYASDYPGASMGEAVLCRQYAEQARAVIAKAKGDAA